MSVLSQCKKYCERFVRTGLPAIAQVAPELPTIPHFRAIPGSRPGRTRFIKETEPNWWQLPRDLKSNLLKSVEGRNLVPLLACTPPFSDSIGKWICMPPRGLSSRYSSDDIAREILVSYLFAAGTKRWKRAQFERVWKDCVSYFNPADRKVEVVLYAPIWGMPRVGPRINLEGGLEIRRIPPVEMARLASLDPALAGVQLPDRLTLWPAHFFVRRYEGQKTVETKDPARDPARSGQVLFRDWASSLSEEVAMLRSLLGPELAVPTYAVIRDGYPRDPSRNYPSELPWRARLISLVRPRSRSEVTKYARRRVGFLRLQNRPSWENAAASMRRFAVAWENSFPADRLADVVAALERLIVAVEKDEASYKLRVRTAHLLARSTVERRQITSDLRDAYRYRSRVVHGDFVFDQIEEWQQAIKMKRAKGKEGNPFYDANEIHRLTYKVADYYHRVLRLMIDGQQLTFDWAALGL